MKGCPDVVVVIVLLAVLIMVVCGLPNKLLVDDAITLLPIPLAGGNKPVKVFALVTK